jgi:preprotein translocase subunit SecE
MADLLNEHAEMLTSGIGNEEDLLAQHSEDSDVLADLVALSRRLYDTLVPVEPSSTFVSNLKTAITDETNAQAGMAKRWRTRRIRFAQRSSVLGTVVSVLAVIALITRFIASIVMIIALLVSRRRHPAAA